MIHLPTICGPFCTTCGQGWARVACRGCGFVLLGCSCVTRVRAHRDALRLGACVRCAPRGAR